MNLLRELYFLLIFILTFILAFITGNVFVSLMGRLLFFFQDHQWERYSTMDFWSDVNSGCIIGFFVGVIWFTGLQFFKKRNKKKW